MASRTSLKPKGYTFDLESQAEKLAQLSIESAVKFVTKAIIKRVKFLGWGPLPFLLSFFLERALTWLAKEGLLMLRRAWISIEVDSDVERMEEARKHAQDARKKGYKLPDETLDEIDSELVDASRGLVRIGRTDIGLSVSSPEH